MPARLVIIAGNLVSTVGELFRLQAQLGANSGLGLGLRGVAARSGWGAAHERLFQVRPWRGAGGALGAVYERGERLWVGLAQGDGPRLHAGEKPPFVDHGIAPLPFCGKGLIFGHGGAFKVPVAHHFRHGLNRHKLLGIGRGTLFGQPSFKGVKRLFLGRVWGEVQGLHKPV